MKILFVVSDPAAPSSNESVLATILGRVGTVTMHHRSTAAPADLDTYDLVWLSSSISSVDSGAGPEYRDFEGGLVVGYQSQMPNYLVNTETFGVAITSNGMEPVPGSDPEHPLFMGLSGGNTFWAATEGTRFRGRSSGWGSGVTELWQNSSSARYSALAVYEEGAILSDETTPAPGRRVVFITYQLSLLTVIGEQLHEEVALWAGSGESIPEPFEGNTQVGFGFGDWTPRPLS